MDSHGNGKFTVENGDMPKTDDKTHELELKIRPVGNHFIARKNDEVEIKNEYGFILPKDFHQKPMECTVTDISDDFENDGLGLTVGDVVLLPKYGGLKICNGTEEYHLCHRKDIIGIL